MQMNIKVYGSYGKGWSSDEHMQPYNYLVLNVRETLWSVKENSFSSSTTVQQKQKQKQKPAYEAQESAVKWQFVILLVSLREQLWKRHPVPELFNGQWQNDLNPANKEPQALLRQVTNWY